MAEGGEGHIRKLESHYELIVEFSWGFKFSHCRNYWELIYEAFSKVMRTVY